MINNPQIQAMMAINKFTQLSAVQREMLPLVLKDQSVIATSPTGTGKTHAYLFGIFIKVNPKINQVQAIITAPTRELAMQIMRFAQVMLPLYPELRLTLATGGKTASSKKNALLPHIVIGTPGRLVDLFIKSQTLPLHTAQIIVIDEADMTLEAGFLEDIDAVLSRVDRQAQILVFSATIPIALQPFLKKYLGNLKVHHIAVDPVFNPSIQKLLINAKHHSYQDFLLKLLPTFLPNQCIIFTNTKEEAIHVSEALIKAGYQLTTLHKDLSAAQRKNAINQLISLKVTYVVATDMAARGLDFEHVSHVVSLGFPTDLSFFKHRIGRTGRAGKSGVAITIYKTQDDMAIRSLMKQKITFEHLQLVNNQLKPLTPYGHKRVFRSVADKKAISIIKGKHQEVKPGYKKKQQAEIKQYEAKKRREMIKKKINEAKKTRAKLKQSEQKGDL